MAEYTTGQSLLPDVGELSYNGCTFGPYFTTQFSGKQKKDAAGWTVIYVEYTLAVEGFVTLDKTETTTDNIMLTLHRLLSQQGGKLAYTGKGFMNLIVNGGGAVKDVAWGPVPEILDFEPLGAGRAAKIRWQVMFRIPYQPGNLGDIMQFNEETSVGYDEEGYARLSIRGTLEIPLTRATVNSRNLTTTVDNYRARFLNAFTTVAGNGIDLSRYRVVRREFNVSRDKRVMEWSFEAEELPYMNPPLFCLSAHGSFDIKPVQAGPGMAAWTCTLRGTYTIRKDHPRRAAWFAFLAMLQWRMHFSVLGNVPPQVNNAGAQAAAGALTGAVGTVAGAIGGVAFANSATALYNRIFTQQQQNPPRAAGQQLARKAWLWDFNVSEGLYLDSRTTTFSASWRLMTTISHILVASGLWRKAIGDHLWALSVQDISGSKSWLSGQLDPTSFAIVDFGGGQ